MAGDRVNVISPEGEYGNLPVEQAKEAVLKYGYRIPTSEETQGQLTKEKYETDLEGAKTAAESAASAATFGLSRHLESALGIATPEEQAARLQYNPSWGTAGTAAGIIGSTVILPGGGLIGGVEKLGSGLTKGIGTALGEGAVSRVVSHAVGSALVGSAFGVGQSIDEKALGDPNLTAQKVWSNIGLGALIGGAIGTATGLLSKGAPSALASAVKEETPEAVVAPIEGTEAKAQDLAEKMSTPKSPVQPQQIQDVLENPQKYQVGTETIPTMDEAATLEKPGYDYLKGKQPVKAKQAFLDDMQKFDDRLVAREKDAQELITKSGVSLTKDEFKSLFTKGQEELLGEFSVSEGRESAMKELQKYADRVDAEAERTGKDILTAKDLRKNLQQLWKDNKRFFKMGLTEPTAEEEAINGVTQRINDVLKTKIDGYGDLMDEYSNEVRLMQRLKRQFKWNPQTEEPAISNWMENRIRNPLFKASQGSIDEWGQNLKDLSSIVGRDWQQIVDSNNIFSKVFPESAGVAQKVPWTHAIRTAAEAFTNPLATAGKLGLKGLEHAFSDEAAQKAAQEELQGVISGQAIKGNGMLSSLGGKLGSMAAKGSELIGKNAGAFRPLAIKAGLSVLGGDQAHEKVDTLSALERASKYTDQKIDGAIKAILKGDKTGEGFDLKGIQDMSPKDRADILDKIQKRVNELMASPDTLLNQMSKASVLGRHAPNVDAMIKATAMRGLQYIQSILPNTNKLPLDPTYTPSTHEMMNLMKAIRTINKPVSALHDMAHGTLGSSQMNALKAVHPDLYTYMQGKMADHMTSHIARGGKVPGKKQLMMSYFMGSPLHNSATPEFIAKNQQSFIPPQPSQNSVKGGQETYKAMSKGIENTMTPTQKAQAK